VSLTLERGVPGAFEVMVVRGKEEMDSRRTDAVMAGLGEKAVILFGAGSLGSTIGLLLAEAGVGRFTVVDHDRLDGANLSRHTCDLRDLGREKAVAVAEMLERRMAHAAPIVRDILSLADMELAGLVKSHDLVLATTDSPSTQFVVNEACVRTGVPGLFVGAYERACGGEVIVVRPGDPCLFCSVGFRAEVAPEVTVKERRQAYQAADANQLVAEPGLAVDITYLAAIGAAHALAILDPGGSKGHLAWPRRSFTLVHGGSTPQAAFADLFHSPFEVIHALPRRSDPCPVCGWSTPTKSEQPT
jgi:molybdopterin/thiamine biosynthesis adenylyltransferase